MGFTLNLILACDNGCGVEEDYGEDMSDVPFGVIKLPDGWKNHYFDMGTVCGACIKEYEKEHAPKDRGGG